MIFVSLYCTYRDYRNIGGEVCGGTCYIDTVP